MNKESLESLTTNGNDISVIYERASLAKRLFARFIDFLIFVIMLICFFIVSENVVHITPFYKKADQTIINYRQESGLFRYSSARKTWENVSTWLDNNGDTSYDYRVNECEKAVNDLASFIANYPNEGILPTLENYDGILYSQNLLKDFKAAKLYYKVVDEKGLPLFVENSSGEVIKNPDSSANSEYYYKYFYREYTLTNCSGYMISIFPPYYDALSVMSNSLFFIQLPSSVILAGFMTYYLPSLIFRRNKMTIGRLSLQIGLIDSRCLSPTFARFSIRAVLQFFVIGIASLFTFGIPLIISISMMLFSKKHQDFADFMLNITEIDTNKQKIYFNKYEVYLDHTVDHKEPVKFKMHKDI